MDTPQTIHLNIKYHMSILEFVFFRFYMHRVFSLFSLPNKYLIHFLYIYIYMSLTTFFQLISNSLNFCIKSQSHNSTLNLDF